MFKVGDILLAEFPFAETNDSKTRLFLVIADVGDYYWGLMIGTSAKFDDGYAYLINSNEIDFTLPNKESYIRCNIIQTIKKSTIKKKYGRLMPEPLERIIEATKNQIK